MPEKKKKPSSKALRSKKHKRIWRKGAASQELLPALLLIVALITIAAVIATAVIMMNPLKGAAPLPATEAPAETAPPAAANPPASTAPPDPPAAATRPAAQPEQPPRSRGALAIVIDDAGNNMRDLERFLRLPGPLTIAVLPGLPHSAEAARRIRAAGKEVILHQPMEAAGGQDPGPGAIYSQMDSEEIRAILRANIAEIGPVSGMNNHQGSKITADRRIMDIILAFCQEQGIYFLDSRTSVETAAAAAAQSLGMRIAERDIFIDNSNDSASMRAAINAGLAIAASNGSAVMIGHAWSPELAPLLADLYQGILDQGYSFTSASEVIGRQP